MTITLERDDWIPLLELAGVAATLTDVSRYLPTIDELRIDLNRFCIDNGIELQDFSDAQIQQLVSDLVLAEKLVGSDIAEGSNVAGIERAAAPTGLGIAGGNVWVTPPEGSYVLRFYTNGTLATTLTDYYITSLESIGAESGDVVQVCRVVDGVVGWMTSAAVP
jgi:hypothetical protein